MLETDLEDAAPERGDSAAMPPTQPLDGPGGARYPHAGVSQRLVGRGAAACWVFSPADPGPAEASLVLFAHGWSGVNPMTYGGWIRHLVRRGHVVLYPVYQDRLLAPFATLFANAVSGVQAALDDLARRGPACRDTMAAVGHSLGGLLAAKTAALGRDSGLPAVSALALVQPGWGRMLTVSLDDLRRIAGDTLALVIVGDEDRHLPVEQPRAIFAAMAGLDRGNRNFVTVRSDRHGTPPLIADHSAPLSEHEGVGSALSPAESLRRAMGMARLGLRRGRADALDYYGHWKLFDALVDAASSGTCRDVALGGTAPQRFMGVWSDGVAVRELAVLVDDLLPAAEERRAG